jgi:predicted HTH domain antitoxin
MAWVQSSCMQLELPSEVEARLSPESVALHLAIGLFVTEEATLGQASAVAGLPQAQFLRELGRRRIPIHYGADELAEDLSAIAQLQAK